MECSPSFSLDSLAFTTHSFIHSLSSIVWSSVTCIFLKHSAAFLSFLKLFVTFSLSPSEFTISLIGLVSPLLGWPILKQCLCLTFTSNVFRKEEMNSSSFFLHELVSSFTSLTLWIIRLDNLSFFFLFLFLLLLSCFFHYLFQINYAWRTFFFFYGFYSRRKCSWFSIEI